MKLLNLSMAVIVLSAGTTFALDSERYEIILGNFTWQTANIDAEIRGGHLATIGNEEEWNSLKARFGNELLGLFLGASDEAVEGTWRWVTGEDWGFTDWNENQPDNSSGVQDYLWLHPGHPLNWDDIANGEAIGYLLERESPETDTDGDGLSDSFELGFGRYQIIRGTITWTEARIDAAVRGGHLATVTSAQEWEFIRSLFPGGFVGESTAIGGTDSEQEGIWKWVTGESFAFSFWQVGEPNDAEGEEDAVSITPYSGEVWNDIGIDSECSQYLLEFGYPTDPFNSDTDGDGFLDGQENSARSSPLDPLSYPVSQISIYPAVEIEFLSLSQVRYQIQTSNDLLDWETLPGIFIGNGGRISQFFQSRQSQPKFYRVQQLP